MACKTKDQAEQDIRDAFKGSGFNPDSLVEYYNTNLEAKQLDDGEGTVGVNYERQNANDDMHDALTVAITSANDYLADVFVMTAEVGTPFTKEAAEYVDTKMRDNKYIGDIYADTLDLLTGAWNNHEQLQVIKYYVSPDEKWAGKFNNIASIRHDAQQNQIQTLQRMEANLSKDYNTRYTKKADRKNGYKILAKSAIFGIVGNGMLSRITTNGESIADLVTELEGKLKVGKDGTENMRIARDLADLFADKDLTGRKVLSNLEAYGYVQNSTIYADMQALSTLYALQDAKDAATFLTDMYHEDNELFNGFVGLAVSAKAQSDRLAKQKHVKGKGREVNSQKGNLVEDVGPINYHLQSVSFEQLAKDPTFAAANGWEVLRQPVKGGSKGIIKREHTSVVQQGLAGNASYIKTGVPITAGTIDSDSVVVTEEELELLITNNSLFIRDNSIGSSLPSLILTDAEKDTLGYEDDPVMALTRSYAHNTMLLETQIARDLIATTFTKKFKDPDVMETVISPLIAKGEHPPLIDITDDFIYDDLSQDIKNKYRVIDSKVLSDVGGFKNNAKLVRKDMGEQLLGYGKGSIFGDNHKASVYHKRVKDFIRWAKINNIVLNVPKIAGDMSAGFAVATAKGASLQEMITYSKEAYTGVKRIADIRDRKASLLFKRTQTKEGTKAYDNLTKAIEKIDKELASDPFSPAYANGFIQSLGTQLLLEEMTSPQGLQATMEDTIRKFMIKDGKSTALNDGIKKIANWGGPIGLEGLYLAAGDAVKNRLKGESEGDAIKRFGERLGRLKNKEDMTGLVAELMAAPNSSLVQAGGSMTQLADLIPRWIIYKHNINKGMSEQAAVDDALRSLLDYKVALPSSLQFLSDLYLLPYPSFFVRIQRVIFELGTKSPVSLSGQLLLEDYLQSQFGASGANIVDSDIISKILDGRLVSSPTDLATLPYAHLFGY